MTLTAGERLIADSEEAIHQAVKVLFDHGITYEQIERMVDLAADKWHSEEKARLGRERGEE